MSIFKLFPSIFIYRRTWPYICTNVLLFDSIHNFWRTWTDFKREFAKKHSWKIKYGNIIHSNGVIFGLQHTSLSMKLDLFYFIVTLELCVHPIKQLARLSNFWIIWRFILDKKTIQLRVLLVTSHFYVSFCDKINTHTVFFFLVQNCFRLTDRFEILLNRCTFPNELVMQIKIIFRHFWLI